MIRPTALADERAVFELACAFAASFEVTRDRFGRNFAELLGGAGGFLHAAEVRGVLVGYVLAFQHPTFFADGPVVWVEEIMVAPDQRRAGVGRSLMDAVEAWAQLGGAKQIALATRRAAAFYSALGYEESAVYFRKVLSR